MAMGEIHYVRRPMVALWRSARSVFMQARLASPSRALADARPRTSVAPAGLRRSNPPAVDAQDRRAQTIRWTSLTGGDQWTRRRSR
jgi:hypothetical protein